MNLPRRRFLHLAVGAAGLPAMVRIAKAQTYPSRPVTLIVPYYSHPGAARFQLNDVTDFERHCPSPSCSRGREIIRALLSLSTSATKNYFASALSFSNLQKGVKWFSALGLIKNRGSIGPHL